MPQARPLRPIAHWRSGNPAMLTTLMLKPKPFGQLDGRAAAGEGKGRLASGQRAHPADPRPSW